MQGKTINGFELKRLLGMGGMAEVWYAENEIGLKAAVKILSEELSHNAQMQERFLNEAKVMVKLDHPNIRKVYGYGSIDGRPAIIMEYLDGSDLKKRMKDGQRFTDEEMKRWWNQMVDALCYTHAQGIVHRDIKPSNIFIDQKGNAKLLDFGIAKVADTTTGTLTGSTLGTRIYMSPEQVKDPKRVGTASDVYSLAMSFVHLLTGKAPYDSTTSSDYDIQVSIVTKPVDVSKVPVEWRGFLAPFLTKEPADRPALRTFVATKAAPTDEDDGTIDDEASKRPKQSPTNKPSSANSHSGPAPLSPTPNDKPGNKKGLWIGLGIAAAVIVALLLLLRPKPEPTPTDPDTQAYEACQTVADYRAYMRNYGRNALHYADAKAFVDQYVADSIEQARQAQALADAAQKEEAERQAQAKAEKKEDDAYRKCTTLAGCESYLKVYPKGKYVDEVKAKKAELEVQDEAKDEQKGGNLVTSLNSRPSTPLQSTSSSFMQQQVFQDEQTNSNSSTGIANGHEYVDLALPSGTLWATCNVGANKPEDFGNYYAWGETKTKTVYNSDTYKYKCHSNNFRELTKYCNDSDYGCNGFTDNLTILQTGDDPAASNWGSGWRTPSKAQWDELLANTTNKWTVKNGVKGRFFYAKNGNTLFLPAAGGRWDSKLNSSSSRGYYWSRLLRTNYPIYAWNLYFDSIVCIIEDDGRYNGFSVRPVRQK